MIGKLNEKSLQKSIVQTLNYHGHHVWVQNAGLISVGNGRSRRMIKIGQAGLSDVIGIHKSGKMIAIEVKLPERRKFVTSLQQNFLDEVIKRGGLSGVATSIDEALAITGDKQESEAHQQQFNRSTE